MMDTLNFCIYLILRERITTEHILKLPSYPRNTLLLVSWTIIIMTISNQGHSPLSHTHKVVN